MRSRLGAPPGRGVVRATGSCRAAGRVAVTAVVAATAVVGVAGGREVSASTPPTVLVTASACAPNWLLPPSGLVSFDVEDQAAVTVDVELVDRVGGAVVAALKELAPRTEQPLIASLPRGAYRLLCTYDNPYGVSISKPYAQRTSSVAKVTSGVPAASATPAYLPTTAAQMAGPVERYDTYVAGQITVLQSEVAKLESDINQRDTAQAKLDWSSAELTFSGIGGTYGAVGGLEDAINGLASGFAGGSSNPQFKGLHKVEYLLWSDQPVEAIEPYVNNVAVAVRQLALKWSQGAMTPNLLSTRAHEILEDALRDTLSGDDDEGSGSSLAIVWADLQGERLVLNLLRGLIDQRSPGLLSTVDPELKALGRTLQATQVSGQWVALDSLTATQKETIDADVDQALETLAPIPDLLEVQGFTDGQET
jgi:high-affinity iron transporter